MDVFIFFTVLFSLIVFRDRLVWYQFYGDYMPSTSIQWWNRDWQTIIKISHSGKEREEGPWQLLFHSSDEIQQGRHCESSTQSSLNRPYVLSMEEGSLSLALQYVLHGLVLSLGLTGSGHWGRPRVGVKSTFMVLWWSSSFKNLVGFSLQSQSKHGHAVISSPELGVLRN